MVRHITGFAAVILLVLLTFGASSRAQTNMSAPIYYNVIGLGSSEGDSAFWYPYPMAVLEMKDTTKYIVRLRFPYLGILGNEEDTLTSPTHLLDSMTFGFRAARPILHFALPSTPYVVMVETIDRNTGKVVEIRPLPYRMSTERFGNTRIDKVREPESNLAHPLLRREFKPALLPLSIDVNPGWRSREQFDTSGTYLLSFNHPTTNELELTVTVRSASIADIDSGSWEQFKEQARITFGERGIAVNSVGDFAVEDPAARSTLKAGYELLAKREDGGTDYIAAYLTPKAVILLMAPLSEPAPSAEYDYFRAIARSFRLK